MADVVSRTRTVYFAPTKGRHYLTLTAACRREAGAVIERKYPAEARDRDSGDPGWHWSEDERLRRVHERLSRLIQRRFQRG